jgi:hypothetical protein
MSKPGQKSLQNKKNPEKERKKKKLNVRPKVPFEIKNLTTI